jgi:hypothetical protein
MPSTEPLLIETSRPTTAMRPVWLFVTISAILNLVLPPAIDAITPNGSLAPFLYAIPIGMVSGELFVLIVLSTLSFRSWLTGYFFGLGTVVLLFGVIGLTQAPSWNEFLEAAAAFCFVPICALSAAIPLYVCRHFARWRLCRSTTEMLSAPPQIADLLAIIAIAGAAVVISKAPSVIWDQDREEAWIPIFIACGVLLGVATVVTPLAVWVQYRVTNRFAAFVGQLFATLALIVIALSIAHSFLGASTGSNEFAEVIMAVSIAITTASVTFGLFSSLLRAYGLRLLRLPRGQPDDEFDSDSLARLKNEIAKQRRRTWWAVAATILVTVLVSIYLAMITARRSAADRENERLSRIAKSLDGSLIIADRSINVIELGPRTSDDDLDHFSKCLAAQYLQLNCPKLTDAGVKKIGQLVGLKKLKIKSGKITDAGIAYLQTLRSLIELDLSGTNVNGSGLAPLIGKVLLTDLNLDYSTVDDDACGLLAKFHRLQNLSLRGTLITDAGLRKLDGLRALKSLDLSETSVDGSGLGHHRLTQLQLRDTFVNDATVKLLGKRLDLQSLDLDNTAVTDDSVAFIREWRRLGGLIISSTAITDAGLAQLDTLTELMILDISRTPITGAGFQTWDSTCVLGMLVANGSSLEDRQLEHLKKFAHLHSLQAAKTPLSDAGLLSLSKSTIMTLNLKQTRVTASGILAHAWPHLESLHFDIGQISDADVSRLRQKLGIKVYNYHAPEDERNDFLEMH